MSALAERIARVDARAEDLRREREEARAQSRAMFPLFSEKVDELRRVFGEVKVTYAEENGNRRGRPFEERR